MPNDSQPVTAVPATGQWKPDVIFSVLVEPARRALLFSLAAGQAKPASVLRGATSLRLDATLKHLSVLRAAGLLVTAPDPVDERRTLYSLAPTVPVVNTDAGIALDFGCCLVRAGA
jgi:DNA-binding transcriptional ArsR family regulator